MSHVESVIISWMRRLTNTEEIREGVSLAVQMLQPLLPLRYRAPDSSPSQRLFFPKHMASSHCHVSASSCNSLTCSAGMSTFYSFAASIRRYYEVFSKCGVLSGFCHGKRLSSPHASSQTLLSPAHTFVPVSCGVSHRRRLRHNSNALSAPERPGGSGWLLSWQSWLRPKTSRKDCFGLVIPVGASCWTNSTTRLGAHELDEVKGSGARKVMLFPILVTWLLVTGRCILRRRRARLQ